MSGTTKIFNILNKRKLKIYFEGIRHDLVGEYSAEKTDTKMKHI
jgi:hypothetical protein